MINEYLSALADYAVENKLIDKSDITYSINRVLNIIGADCFEKKEYPQFNSIEDILNGLTDYANEQNKIVANTITYRDIISSDIMDCFTPLPSTINNNFYDLYLKSPESATQYFYSLSKANNYIMTQRVKKDIKWTSKSKYGDLIITINLSKPEKDPRDIARAKEQKSTGYPKCALCAENVGFEGDSARAPRANHRVVPVDLMNEHWFLQYSPYVYYNEHCILLNSNHTPMKIDINSFDKLLDFVGQFPHYFAGSNADLPIVGGSILTHDHFQGGKAVLPMELATSKMAVHFDEFEDVEANILNWALSTLRISSTNAHSLSVLGDKILTCWRAYSDEENEILAYTNAPHNTITPIARKKNGKFELDLILRNNRTTEEHPLGIFHPHAEFHHIKKENIGLIEAMGLAVLPSRLTKELDITDKAVQVNIGQIFMKILENCAVFKDNQKGDNGFIKFINFINSK